MENDYRFLTDHSYTMIDYDTISLQRRAMKNKNPNKTASIDRSSSDKENNVSNTTKSLNTSKNKTKSSTKKKSTRSNLSANSRTQFKKQQKNKSSSKNGIKSSPGINTIKKKVSTISKSMTSHSIDTFDSTPILSIEERVKLRRTKVFTATPIKPVLSKKSHLIPKKRINTSKTNTSVIKSKKYFLGSGLDLDNIVLGNRQRRSAK